MLKKWWWLGALILLACQVASAPATFTPGPDNWQFGNEDVIQLPTVRPYQTQAPTPTQEVMNIRCDSINGWTLSPHCGLNPWFVAANSNSDLIAVISAPLQLSVNMPNAYPVTRDVYVPAPPGLYEWYFATVGHDGVNIIRDMPPIVSHNGAGFEMNITGLTGYAALRLQQVELFTPPGRYVVGFEITPRLRLPDASRTNPALLTKQCKLRTDTGRQYELPVQNAGHNQYQPVLDSAVYVITIDRPLNLHVECGISMAQPVFDGVVIWERMFVEAVPPDYGNTALRIE